MDTFTISVSRQSEPAELTTLHLSGRLDSENELRLRDQAIQLHASGARHLLLDLEKVDFISSAGLRAIHIIYKLFTPPEEITAWRPGGDVYKTPYLKLVCPSPKIYGVLNLAGFLHNISFFNNMADALASFGQP